MCFINRDPMFKVHFRVRAEKSTVLDQPLWQVVNKKSTAGRKNSHRLPPKPEMAPFDIFLVW